jgi:hypothetical protein
MHSAGSYLAIVETNSALPGMLWESFLPSIIDRFALKFPDLILNWDRLSPGRPSGSQSSIPMRGYRLILPEPGSETYHLGVNGEGIKLVLLDLGILGFKDGNWEVRPWKELDDPKAPTSAADAYFLYRRLLQDLVEMTYRVGPTHREDMDSLRSLWSILRSSFRLLWEREDLYKRSLNNMRYFKFPEWEIVSAYRDLLRAQYRSKIPSSGSVCAFDDLESWKSRVSRMPRCLNEIRSDKFRRFLKF